MVLITSKTIQPYRITVKRILMTNIKPGSAFATGRPFTGRNHPITVRLSDLAIDLLKCVKNKSEYIDNLIINSNPSKNCRKI